MFVVVVMLLQLTFLFRIFRQIGGTVGTGGIVEAAGGVGTTGTLEAVRIILQGRYGTWKRIDTRRGHQSFELVTAPSFIRGYFFSS
jgi:hypothetical protein